MVDGLYDIVWILNNAIGMFMKMLICIILCGVLSKTKGDQDEKTLEN